MTADGISKALGGRKVGGGWIARCPAHEDGKPSLSITEAKGGKVLMRCHAGCEQVRVIAVLQATGHPAWAALSTAGLRALDLPEDVRDMIVLADGNAAGEAAARECAWRWKREGRCLRIARPPQGLDFNDLLMSGAPCIEGGAQ
jgi:Toprim domain